MKYKCHEVRGAEGVRLFVREWGTPDGPPILLVHGWSQSSLCWTAQMDGDLPSRFRMVAIDLRGHGNSQKPQERQAYGDARLWADDIAAVIGDLALDRSVLIGWSFGGAVLCDYLRIHGPDRVAGVVFEAAAVHQSRAAVGRFIGPGISDHIAGATNADLAVSIPAMRAFLRGTTAGPVPAEEFEDALAWNMVVPAGIRAAVAGHHVDSDDVLARLTLPVLVIQGREDRIILPAMSQHILDTCAAGTCPAVEALWLDGVGHVPHREAADRFNSALADFARRVQA